MTTTNESSKHIDPAVDAVTTLRAIAEFPVADQFNQDAINMKLTAQNFFHREVARKNLGEIPAGFSKPADGGPAFPLSDSGFDMRGTNHECVNGMTLRDYFAAKAMTSVWADIPHDANRAQALEYLGKCCYEMADSMLKARG